MLPLDDPRWQTFNGGYRVTYDASAPLRRLLNGDASQELWDELWNELHHQGDVDQASYAAVPWLVEIIRRSDKLDWNPVGLIALIEMERPESANPPVAPFLSDAYFTAIRSIPGVLGMHPDQEWSEPAIQSAVTCIALARGQRWFAKAYFELDQDTAGRWFTAEFGWNFGEAQA